jgi:hypothetical protein
VVKV